MEVQHRQLHCSLWLCFSQLWWERLMPTDLSPKETVTNYTPGSIKWPQNGLRGYLHGFVRFWVASSIVTTIFWDAFSFICCRMTLNLGLDVWNGLFTLSFGFFSWVLWFPQTCTLGWLGILNCLYVWVCASRLCLCLSAHGCPHNTD